MGMLHELLSEHLTVRYVVWVITMDPSATFQSTIMIDLQAKFQLIFFELFESGTLL